MKPVVSSFLDYMKDLTSSQEDCVSNLFLQAEPNIFSMYQKQNASTEIRSALHEKFPLTHELVEDDLWTTAKVIKN